MNKICANFSYDYEKATYNFCDSLRSEWRKINKKLNGKTTFIGEKENQTDRLN
jgi:hypothetical protein